MSGALEVMLNSSDVNQPESSGKRLTSNTSSDGINSFGITHSAGIVENSSVDLTPVDSWSLYPFTLGLAMLMFMKYQTLKCLVDEVFQELKTVIGM